MGFGSYDESEQETANQSDERDGESVTDKIKSDHCDAKGESKTEDGDTEELMKHL